VAFPDGARNDYQRSNNHLVNQELESGQVVEWFAENSGVFFQAMLDRSQSGQELLPFALLRSLLMQLFDDTAHLFRNHHFISSRFTIFLARHAVPWSIWRWTSSISCRRTSMGIPWSRSVSVNR
jgi:hypothetical protein